MKTIYLDKLDLNKKYGSQNISLVVDDIEEKINEIIEYLNYLLKIKKGVSKE